MKKITKVVIPVAGKGTRFLPITKTISKTLLPIIDKPVIQYLIEEAINAKIEEALIIIGPNQKDVMGSSGLDADPSAGRWRHVRRTQGRRRRMPSASLR